MLTRPQLRALWLAAEDDQDRRIILLLGHGLRLAEACALRPSDISDGVARIFGKGRKMRRVVLSPAALAVMGDGIKLTPNAVYERVKRLGRRAGLPWVHPHCLRHSFATHFMLAAPGDMETLRTLLGHADNSPLPRYYAHRALESAALDRARAIGLDLFEEP